VDADQYPSDTSGSDGDTVLIPRWALSRGTPPGGGGAPPLRNEGQLGADTEPTRDLKACLRAHLQDTMAASRVRRDIEHEISRRGGAGRIIVYEFPEPRYVGKTLAAIAADRKVSPVDAAIWLQLNGHARPGGGRMRGFSLSEEDIEHIMQQEFTATCTDGDTVQKGDGVPHPRFYGTFPRKIRRYVVERRTVSLPFAIRSMTSLPAQIMGLKDRGVIREGAWADLVVFDLDRIADRSLFTDPHQYPDGIPFVFVNGVAVVDNGQFTKATPGRVLTPAQDSWRHGR
jgi:N-acyl-D-amino-acid deacylase